MKSISMSQWKVLFVLLCSALVLSSCHFVGDAQAEPGLAGFFGGLWDGTVITFSAVLACFTHVQVLDIHNDGTSYKVGFAIGVLFLSWNFGVPCGILSTVLYFLPL